MRLAATNEDYHTPAPQKKSMAIMLSEYSVAECQFAGSGFNIGDV